MSRCLTAGDATRRDDAVQAAALELLAQFPAMVLRAALHGDQWRDVLDAVLDAGRDVAVAASAVDHVECGEAQSVGLQCS